MTILRELKPLLKLKARTVTGKTLGENIAAAPAGWQQNVVRPFKDPIFKGGSIAVLHGNLAPGGAIIKQAAMDQKLTRHEGRAVVFESLEDLANRIDDPKLDVKADDILVMKQAGPKGAPGMPEAGYIPIPKKLAQKGLKDMIRISDARMSGTAFGAIVLHVTPESAAGGPLALVKNGDRIRLDVPARQLELLVSGAELKARRKGWKPPRARKEDARGYRKLFLDTVTQADRGCDFDFLAQPVQFAYRLGSECKTHAGKPAQVPRFKSRESHARFATEGEAQFCRSQIRHSRAGRFCTAAHCRGTRLIEYTGERVTHEEADERYGEEHEDSPHTMLFAVNDEVVIDATHRGSPARWINHSCEPNCEAVEEDGRVFIDARRAIKPGEELTYDYNLVLDERHTPARKRAHACCCGARRCRGTLLGSKR